MTIKSKASGQVDFHSTDKYEPTPLPLAAPTRPPLAARWRHLERAVQRLSVGAVADGGVSCAAHTYQGLCQKVAQGDQAHDQGLACRQKEAQPNQIVLISVCRGAMTHESSAVWLGAKLSVRVGRRANRLGGGHASQELTWFRGRTCTAAMACVGGTVAVTSLAHFFWWSLYHHQQ